MLYGRQKGITCYAYKPQKEEKLIELSFTAMCVDGYNYRFYLIKHESGKWEVTKGNEVIFSADKAESCIFWLNHNELAKDGVEQQLQPD